MGSDGVPRHLEIQRAAINSDQLPGKAGETQFVRKGDYGDISDGRQPSENFNAKGKLKKIEI